MTALQLCRWQFSQINFVADFLQAKCDFTRKTAVLHFWAPLGGLGATYDDHLRLTGKRVVDLLLVLIELFLIGVTADFAPTGAGWLKISGRSGCSPPTILLLRKLNDVSYEIKIWTDLYSVLPQCTLLTDGRTDSFLLTRPPCIQCSAVKIQVCCYFTCMLTASVWNKMLSYRRETALQGAL